MGKEPQHIKGSNFLKGETFDRIFWSSRRWRCDSDSALFTWSWNKDEVGWRAGSFKVNGQAVGGSAQQTLFHFWVTEVQVSLWSQSCFHISSSTFCLKVKAYVSTFSGLEWGRVVIKCFRNVGTSHSCGNRRLWERRHGPVTLGPNLDSHVLRKDLHRCDIYAHQTTQQWLSLSSGVCLR